MANSYHAKERAIDVRSWNVPEDKRLDVAISLRKWITLPFYDVVYEPAVMKDGKIVKGDHYHLEADAKKKEAAYNEHLVAREHNSMSTWANKPANTNVILDYDFNKTTLASVGILDAYGSKLLQQTAQHQYPHRHVLKVASRQVLTLAGCS